MWMVVSRFTKLAHVGDGRNDSLNIEVMLYIIHVYIINIYVYVIYIYVFKNNCSADERKTKVVEE